QLVVHRVGDPVDPRDRKLGAGEVLLAEYLDELGAEGVGGGERELVGLVHERVHDRDVPAFGGGVHVLLGLHAGEDPGFAFGGDDRQRGFEVGLVVEEPASVLLAKNGAIVGIADDKVVARLFHGGLDSLLAGSELLSWNNRFRQRIPFLCDG